MLCSIENIKKRVEHSCLTMVLQLSCQRSHMLYGVRGVDTMFMFC